MSGSGSNPQHSLGGSNQDFGTGLPLTDNSFSQHPTNVPNEYGMDISLRGGSASSQLFATINQYLQRELELQHASNPSRSGDSSLDDFLSKDAFGGNDLQRQLEAITASMDADPEMKSLSNSFGAMSIHENPLQHLSGAGLKLEATLPPTQPTLQSLPSSQSRLNQSLGSLGGTRSLQNLMINASLLSASLKRSIGSADLRHGRDEPLAGTVDLVAAMDATFGKGHEPLSATMTSAAALGASLTEKDAAILASSLTSLVGAVRNQLRSTGAYATLSQQAATNEPNLADALREGVDPNELLILHGKRSRTQVNERPSTSDYMNEMGPLAGDMSVEAFSESFGQWFARKQRLAERMASGLEYNPEDYDRELASSITSTILSLANLPPPIPVSEQLEAFETRRLELGLSPAEAAEAGLGKQVLDELIAKHRAQGEQPKRPADLVRNEPTLQLPIPIQVPILENPSRKREDAMTSTATTSSTTGACSSVVSATSTSVRGSSMQPTIIASPIGHSDESSTGGRASAPSSRPPSGKRRGLPDPSASLSSSQETTDYTIQAPKLPSTPQKPVISDDFTSSQELEGLQGHVRRERREIERKRRERKKLPGCNCKKSRCVKRYCECFAQGKFCTPQCQCLDDCINTNTPENIQLIEQYRESTRRRHAEVDVIAAAAVGASAVAQVVTCNCVKSNCQKNYCQCYQAGMQCVAGCKCVDCLNNKDESLTTITATTVRKTTIPVTLGHPDHPNYKGRLLQGSSGGGNKDWSSSITSSGDFSVMSRSDESKYDGEDDEDGEEDGGDYDLGEGEEEDDGEHHIHGQQLPSYNQPYYVNGQPYSSSQSTGNPNSTVSSRTRRGMRAQHVSSRSHAHHLGHHEQDENYDDDEFEDLDGK